MSIEKVAIFHCEASLEIGTGHVMRCMVLADKLVKNGWICNFVSLQKSYDLIPKLQNFNHIDPHEAWLNPNSCDLLIVDNYSFDENYEKHFKDSAKKILVIDDLANRKHNCDILLDQNLGTKIEDYKNLANKNCAILVGTRYCLLREEFSVLRKKSLEKRFNTQEIKKILVNFGGSDLRNYTIKALKEIEESDFQGEIDVVLGFGAIHFETIIDFVKTSKNKIIVHRQADMAQLIYEADIAFAAGGTSAWERCCLGLPTYLVQIADNQEKIFKELGYKESFIEFYSKIQANYQAYVDEIKDLVDGLGAERVLSEIL